MRRRMATSSRNGDDSDEPEAIGRAKQGARGADRRQLMDRQDQIRPGAIAIDGDDEGRQRVRSFYGLSGNG